MAVCACENEDSSITAADGAGFSFSPSLPCSITTLYLFALEQKKL